MGFNHWRNSIRWKKLWPAHPEIIQRVFYSRYGRRELEGRVLGIRREDQSVWERRAPFSPHQVRKLVRAGAKVLVQPSNRRAYPMQDYAASGAIIKEDISEAPVIVGVKQVPIDALIPHRTYCFFSHTIKAQAENMALLDAILEKNIRLVDYEKMVNERGERVVAFGKYAGVAGMINILHGLGLRLLALGHHTPFMHIGPAHNYRNTEMAKAAVRDAGYEISLGNLPKSLGALTVVFTGSGNVSQGAQEIFRQLPYEYIPPQMLKKVAEHGEINKVYGCEVSRPDHYVRKDGGPFDPDDFEAHPENYYSSFSKKIAPYASVIVNGIYWAPNSPRLLSIPDAKSLLRPAYTPWLPSSPGSPQLPHRLLAICDISADPGGSIEFMDACTTIDTPFCLYDADQHTNSESFKGPGVLVCSIDNMPTQLPREATDFFGGLLFPHIGDILKSDATASFEPSQHSPAVAKAVIASNGKLTPDFEYISELRAYNRSRHKSAMKVSETQHTVLMLGAGHVSAPVVEYLTRDSSIRCIAASALKDEADTLASRFPNVEPILLDVQDRQDLLSSMVQSADIVISLLPYSLHPLVAKKCIEYKKNLVTASYCTPEMHALHDEAVAAGITVLNEVGLDPGIDHLLAMEIIDEVHNNGGKVESFTSYCGGIPAPEYSDSPLRYKFSWSPRGVLLNTLSPAKYLLDGKVVEIPSGGALMSHAKKVDFLPGFALEGYPNRDSTIYKELYGIPEAKTVLRGTLRYQGYAEAIRGLLALGLIDTQPHPSLHPKGPEITWRELICNLLEVPDSNLFYENLRSKVLDRVGPERCVGVVEKLGLLSEDPVFRLSTPLDSLCHYLSNFLALEENERDIVILRHDITIRWGDHQVEKRGVTLVEYGEARNKGYSAMAKTVGYPTAIATKMVLNGEIQGKGMMLPFSADVYRPMLSRLQKEGICAQEKMEQL